MTDLATLEREADAAERRAVALRKFVEVARDLGEEGLAEVLALVAPSAIEPAPTVVPFRANPEQPSGRSALRIIVRERPGVWTLAELKEALVERGWFTSDKGVEAAASRLCRLNGEGRRVGKGRYIFPANYEPGDRQTGIEEVMGGAQSDASGVSDAVVTG